LEGESLRGFTLLEVLISVALIVILTAIAVPAYTKYRQRTLISRVQQNLVSCVSELTAEFADSGVKEKDCQIPGAGNCTLQISENGTFVKIANDYCDFQVEGINLRCYIRTDYGDVNGFVYCETQ
jgi:prepilin-type N-terminal cleavage/methylation domain-containing protein